MAEREPIGVVGTGYVGLVTAAGFAELGNEVWCVDIDADKIARLQRGEIPIYEPGLEELVARNRERMHFSTDIADALAHARLLFVAVGTPPTYSGDPDLSAVHAVVEAMPPSDRHALVMKSTVPVGTGAAIKRHFVEQGKGDFRYVSCPEFLREGSAVNDFLHPDRVVVGDDGDWAGDAVVELYAPLGAPLVRTDIASAEMVKLAANAFLATKISFINEIANVCEETGADVIEVARGMGLDNRIGPKFLQAGIGFGGSCLAGDETVLARRGGRARITTLERLWDEGAEDLEVLAWRPGREGPEFLPVIELSRVDADELLEVRTTMGRRVVCTPDHPFVVGDGEIKLARELTTEDRVPLALGPASTASEESELRLYTLAALELAGLTESDVIVRPAARHLAGVFAEQAGVLDDRTTSPVLSADVVSGDVPGLGPMRFDEAFWRIVGLYLAEGCCIADGERRRLMWSFHPTREEHLVDEVAGFWRARGVKVDVRRGATAANVVVSSRLLAAWWTSWLGVGRDADEQRLPDLIWDQPAAGRRALLSGLFEGGGSWSPANGGPSVIIELGTVSDELADGVLRLLAMDGIVASQRIGRTQRSTKDAHRLRISGADQIERAIHLVPKRDRPGVLASIARQSNRIAPTGYAREGNAAWVRVTSIERRPAGGHAYSMEVSGLHTVVTTGGLVVHNCFPKDVLGLKQLAGNSGYHFQLLNAVIEVNELQKRRVINKLHKYLGSLVGKRIALLGLAFKPNTDDMREASSLVLSARLQADGAHVVAHDPVAEDEARRLISGVEFAEGPLDAVRGADAVVLVTEWKQFTELDWNEVAAAMAGDVVIDGRNALDPAAVRAAGLRYEGVGRGRNGSVKV